MTALSNPPAGADVAAVSPTAERAVLEGTRSLPAKLYRLAQNGCIVRPPLHVWTPQPFGHVAVSRLRSKGTIVYTVGGSPATGYGVEFALGDFNEAYSAALRALHRDEDGDTDVKEVLADGAETEFDMAEIEAILSVPIPEDDWRLGETFAASYLEDNGEYRFPWPATRDARNQNGIATGTDHVGFRTDDDGNVRFAFGEVKTSSQNLRPPLIMQPGGGAGGQLLKLRPDREGCRALLKYLARRAKYAAWREDFVKAMRVYRKDRAEIDLVAVLVRPLTPHSDDLDSNCSWLSVELAGQRAAALYALYVPPNTFADLRASWKRQTS